MLQLRKYVSLSSCCNAVIIHKTQIWDVAKLKRTRTMAGHRQRVGTQAWSSHVLASGSRDKAVLLRDVRLPQPYVEKLSGHKSEVCGLKVG